MKAKTLSNNLQLFLGMVDNFTPSKSKFVLVCFHVHSITANTTVMGFEIK